ncbi:MAG: hypothetical protein LBB73_09880 [Dysgonamonadaceae bacterium]|nr:hypothetical protein [Dysgonamonadaceae bacterium]
MEGTIDFKEDIQEWYISVHTPGTYDEVKVFFPCNLEESCKKANEKVLFSGVAFDPLSDSDLSGFTAGCIFFVLKYHLLNYSNRETVNSETDIHRSQRTYKQTGFSHDDFLWNFPDSAGLITEEAMKENMKQTEIAKNYIDKDSLNKYASKIALLNNSDYTEYHNANNMGAFVFTPVEVETRHWRRAGGAFN